MLQITADVVLKMSWSWDTRPRSKQRDCPPRCTKCNSPPINDQCTNFLLFDV